LRQRLWRLEKEAGGIIISRDEKSSEYEPDSGRRMMAMKTQILTFLAIGGLLASSGLAAKGADTQVQASVGAILPATAAPQYSGRINEVVSLAKSGLEESVVISYIKSSPGPFQPSADEIIRLRDAGISSQVINAMLQRGAEVRDQAQMAAAAAPAAQDVSANYSQPAQTYAQPAAPVVATPPVTYVQPASSVIYVGSSYGYPVLDSRYYYPYSCYYPSYYYPRVGFGFAPQFNFRFGGGFHGGFHGGGFHH
jgi:hypothetical protein